MSEYQKEVIAKFEKVWTERRLKNIHIRSVLFNSMIRVHRILHLAIDIDLPRDQVLKYLVWLKDLGVAHFMSSMKHGETLSLPIGDQRIEIVGERISAYMDTNTWLIIFYAALVCRDGNAVDILRDVPEEFFLSANIKPDPFDLAFVRVTKGLYDDSVKIAELLVEAMLASDESYIPEGRVEYAWSTMLPILMLYRYVINGDTDGEFDSKFEYALQQHRKYWQRDVDNRKIHFRAWKSLPLMAAAVMCYDTQRLEMPNDNELVPRWMVEAYPFPFHTHSFYFD